MKKIVVFMMMFFLVFSINSLSQDKPPKANQSAKIEHSKSKNAKAGVNAKKKEFKKRMHRPRIKKQSRKIRNNMIKR